MAIALHEPRLTQRVEQWAHEMQQPVEQVLEQAVSAYLDGLEREAIVVETDRFWRLREELIAAYPNEYVALHDGEVVDHDLDVTELERRIRIHFGALPVLIAPVQSPPPRELNWLGGEILGTRIEA